MITKEFKSELEMALEAKGVKHMPSVVFALELIDDWPSDIITLKQLRQLARDKRDEEVLKALFTKALSKKRKEVSW